MNETIRYAAEAAAFFPMMAFFKLLGIDAASAVGGLIGRHIFYRLPVIWRARDNLRAAYPEKSAEDVEAILREMSENLGRTVAEYAHLDKLTYGAAGARLEVVGTEISDAAVASGKGVMLISGHFANWEVMAVAATLHGYDSAIVYRPPNNPYVGRWISRQRAKRGPKEQISKGAYGTRRVFTMLRRGKPIMMLVDQKTEEGVPAPFFGRNAMTTSAPASLALKLGAVLVPVSNERLRGAYFRVTIHPPIEFAASGDHERDVVALTAEINKAMEACVRRRPSQWLWIHRRWTSPRDALKHGGKNRQTRAGAGARVERDGSSLT